MEKAVQHWEMARPAPPEDIWVDARLVVARSGIEGQGLVATEDIPAGTVLVRLGGRLVSTAELAELISRANADPAGAYVDSITVYEDAHLVLPGGSTAHFGNHSCDPSAWIVGPYEIGARLEIASGEEVTLDYGTISGPPGFSMACRCASGLCRGEVTSEDWRRPELQARYGQHWVPALRARIEGPERSTDRLRLRRIAAGDLPALVAIHTDPATNLHTPDGPPTAEWTLQFLEQLIQAWDEHGIGYWSVEFEGELIGVAGIEPRDFDGRSCWNLYYRLTPRSWGQGLASEAVREAVRVAEVLHPDWPVVARTRPSNLPSARVAQRAGLERRGDLDRDGYVVFARGW